MDTIRAIEFVALTPYQYFTPAKILVGKLDSFRQNSTGFVVARSGTIQPSVSPRILARANCPRQTMS